MKTIPFGKIIIGDIAKQHIKECLDNNWISEGSKVKLFETEWGKLFDYPYNVAVSSGTDACIAACLALYDYGAHRGDEIIIPALSFIATANAVRAAGFIPVFVDVKKETLNIDEDLIEQYITKKTRAIMVVHTMGKPCNLYKIKEIVDKYKLILIQDCCENPGSQYKGQRVGAIGHMAAFSFYAAHLICCGEGGMVSTPYSDFADSLKSVKSHGREINSLYFNHVRTGLNLKMNDLEASIGLEGVANFWDIFWRRHDSMVIIRSGLDKFSDKAWFSDEDEGDINCPHGFSITCKEPNRIVQLKNCLDKAQIEYKRNFGSIPTQHKAFDDMGYQLGNFPNAEYIGDNGIHIGLHPYLTDEDIFFILNTIIEGLT